MFNKINTESSTKVWTEEELRNVANTEIFAELNFGKLVNYLFRVAIADAVSPSQTESQKN